MTRDRLLGYFERELTYMRKKGLAFAQRFPGVASALDLKAAGTTDPHVERLIESFAFLTARINHKMDEAGGAISTAMLEVLFPHLIRPIPAVAIAQFVADPSRGKATTSHIVPARTQLHSNPIQEQSCYFQTCFDVALSPLTVSAATLGSPRPDGSSPLAARSSLRITLSTDDGAPLRDLNVDSLRLHIAGGGYLPYRLYDFMLNETLAITTSSTVGEARVKPVRAAAAGMHRSEGLLPYSEITPLGHRLLLEYLFFPQKFLFVDLLDLGPHLARCEGSILTVELFSAQPPPIWEADVSAACFQLGCTPIVNCFQRVADPIVVDQRSTEYRLVPHPYRQEAMEVYSVDEVQGASSTSRKPVPYRPLYAIDGAAAPPGSEDRFWVATRHASHRPSPTDCPTDVYLTVVDSRGEVAHLSEDILSATVTCTNHNLPSRLPFVDGQGRSQLSTPGSHPGSIRCLTQPTPSLRKSLNTDAQWQLVSMLSLGYASLSDPQLATSSLKHLLRLLDPTGSGAVAQQIDGVVSVSSRPISARINAGGGVNMALGLEVTVELDPEAFVGGSPYLFGSILDQFFGLLAPLNSFSKTRVRLTAREGLLAQWAPRSGQRSLS